MTTRPRHSRDRCPTCGRLVCGWTWGSELSIDRTECPARPKHQGLMKARRLRSKHRKGEPVSVGDLLVAAEDSLL
jgi:hypothetical protein